MLQFINENLFTFSTIPMESDQGTRIKTLIKTTSAAISNRHDKTVNDEKGSHQYSDRIFASVTSSTEDYNKENISANVITTNNNVHKCIIKSSSKNKYDSEIYCVAIPFNGIMTPIEPSPDYRIIKGMLITSDKYSIAHDNRKYKKVLYLMLEINRNTLFGNDKTGEPARDIVISFESHYSMYKKENGKIINIPDKWNKEVTTVKINTEETIIENERVSDVEFNRDMYADKSIYKLYVKPEHKVYGSDDLMKKFTRKDSYNKKFK